MTKYLISCQKLMKQDPQHEVVDQNASVCDNKQRWKDDKWRSECKKLIDKGRSDKGFIWNPSDVSGINHVMLENIYIMKIVNAEKSQLISQQKNVVRILMKMK